MKRSLILILFLLLLFNTTIAQTVSGSLIDDVSYEYVEKLIAVAKENYPRIKSHNSKIAMSKAAITDAKLSWFTPFGLSYVYSPATTINLENPTFFSGYQLGLSLNIGAVLKTPIAIKRAKEDLKVTKYDFDEYLLFLATDVKQRYFNYLLAVRALKLSTQSNLDAASLLSRIKYRYEKGEVAFEDYNNALTASINSSQTKLNAEGAFLVAKSSLEELLGVKLEQVPD
ncbi:MAG TPA: TolC family protein [Pedobacter sp.]